MRVRPVLKIYTRERSDKNKGDFLVMVRKGPINFLQTILKFGKIKEV
jgi:hypothetical protein